MDQKLLTPSQMLDHWEHLVPGNVYMRQPMHGAWRTYTWRETAEQVRKMASALKSMEFPQGSKVAILSKNCAHWIMSDYAIWLAGYISVPMYPNLTAATIRQILEHSECKLLFAGKLDDWETLKPGVPGNIPLITFPGYGVSGLQNWDDVIRDRQPLEGTGTASIGDLATIMYTSGTTGMPKGVMHSFHNFAYAVTNALPELHITGKDRFFSYLPMCHIAERLLVEMGSLYAGAEVSFAESLETFPENVRTAQPTVFLAVPRIWAKFQEKILEIMPQKRLDLLLRLPVIKNVVRKRIRKGLGLSHAVNIFSGAAPISADLIRWFARAGIPIQQAYAMTEDCCYSHVNLREENRIGTVGQHLPEVQVRISPEGEIQLKHPALMLGYYKDPAMTREALTEDGFFRTGDKGQIDTDGYLRITGRIKELFKTSKGKYVSPTPIEIQLLLHPDIDQALVVGYGLPQPICLLVLNAQGKKQPVESLEKSITGLLHDVNDGLDPYEHLEKAVIMAQEWTTENGMLTPTLKIRRNAVENLCQPYYEKWYHTEGTVIWSEI